MKKIKYRDPIYGDINIDLETDKFPKSFFYSVFIAGGIFFFALGALALVVMVSLLFQYFEPSGLFTLIFPVAGFIAGILFFVGAKKYKKKYYAIRQKLIMQEENRAKGVKDNSAYISIESVEIGTNLIGWVRGIDSLNNLSPVTTKVTFTNHLGKVIKYLKITLTPLNGVDDPVCCTVTQISTYEMTGTGPFACGCSYWLIMNDGWYNNTIEKVVIDGIEAIYMDGSSEVLSDAQIRYATNKKIMSDNESRVTKRSLGTFLMIISSILDVVSLIGVFTMSSEVFGVILFLSTITFIIGLNLKR